MSNELTDAIVGMREDEALAIVGRELDGGADPTQVLEEAKDAMTVLGEKFECGDAFIPELIMGGEIMKGISELVKPRLRGAGEAAKRGTVVIGTVQGDIHDIGKDVVVLMLDVNGYEVHDLGVDVSTQAFVDAIRTFEPQVVGLSGLLTLAFDSMKATVDAIVAAGLRERVKIMVGGAPADRQVQDYTGADGWGSDVAAALKLAGQWTGGEAK
ncbi:MAG: cobalamin B12-binding domain-containing protein [Thermoleophilia bacterium]